MTKMMIIFKKGTWTQTTGSMLRPANCRASITVMQIWITMIRISYIFYHSDAYLDQNYQNNPSYTFYHSDAELDKNWIPILGTIA